MADEKSKTEEKKPRKKRTMRPRPATVLLSPNGSEGGCPVNVLMVTRDAAKALDVLAEANADGKTVFMVRTLMDNSASADA